MGADQAQAPEKFEVTQDTLDYLQKLLNRRSNKITVNTKASGGQVSTSRGLLEMTTHQKYVLVDFVGRFLPIVCVLLGHRALAFAAVAIAWWHGYMAARLELRVASEKQQTPA